MDSLKNWAYAFILWFLISVCFGLIVYTVKTQELYERIAYLINEGYTFEASEHIAKVELGIIKPDAEYIALMED